MIAARVRKPAHMANITQTNPHGVPVPATEPAAEVSGLVTKRTVAKAACVSTRCIELWMARRLIPFVRISPRCVRFHLASVLAALRRLEIKEVR